MCITHIFPTSTLITTKKIQIYRKTCPHNKRHKSSCIQCKGASICIHDKQRNQCKHCKGKNICLHNKARAFCKQCGGSAICMHNKDRRYCKECKGTALCIHNRDRKHCMMCCPHPVLSCQYTLCTLQSKNKYTFRKHEETHTEKFQQQKKIHEQKIQKLLDSNDIAYTREHNLVLVYKGYHK